VDDDRPATLAGLGPEAARPRHQVHHGVRPLAGRDRAAQRHDRAPDRHPVAAPGPAATERHLGLHDRAQAVQVGTFEEADLDETHGHGRIREGHPPGPAVPPPSL
jgi:hypothetical protein